MWQAPRKLFCHPVGNYIWCGYITQDFSSQFLEIVWAKSHVSGDIKKILTQEDPKPENFAFQIFHYLESFLYFVEAIETIHGLARQKANLKQVQNHIWPVILGRTSVCLMSTKGRKFVLIFLKPSSAKHEILLVNC